MLSPPNFMMSLLMINTNLFCLQVCNKCETEFQRLIPALFLYDLYIVQKHHFMTLNLKMYITS